MKEDSNFRALMEATHARVECARLKFPDFIAKVQRDTKTREPWEAGSGVRAGEKAAKQRQAQSKVNARAYILPETETHFIPNYSALQLSKQTLRFFSKKGRKRQREGDESLVSK